ncbi:MAG: PPK2 family polyphosphate kinase [Acidimicrobiales bacterium]
MGTDDRSHWLARPGEPVWLDGIDTRSTDGAPGDERATKALFPGLLEQLAEFQERLYADGRQKLLVVLQAMDGGGKGGTVEHVFHGVNPQGVRVASFKVPTEEELAHDFLWRIHRHAPRSGEIAVFDRSHYEDVLVVRVRELAPESVWRPRYDQIVAFEELLADAGTTIVKLFLHISPDEQAERLQARLDEPHKRWKFRKVDLDERARWHDYLAAYEEAIARTSKPRAPWYVVPADRKWYRNWAVLRILLETLHEMNPRWPDPDEDLTGVTIPPVSPKPHR